MLGWLDEGHHASRSAAALSPFPSLRDQKVKNKDTAERYTLPLTAAAVGATPIVVPILSGALPTPHPFSQHVRNRRSNGRLGSENIKRRA